jgi:hypothetical protein
MVGQAVHVLGQPLPGECLEGLHDPGVQAAPPLLEETAVGHLMGEGMLEGIGALGKQAGLIEELGSLEVVQALV